MCEIQTVEHGGIRGADYHPMNIDGSCSVPNSLETQVQSPSYALNECQGKSQLVMDLSHITRNKSNVSERGKRPGSPKDNICTASRAMDFEQIVSHYQNPMKVTQEQ